MPYSGFFRRALALMIDIIIVSLPAIFVFAPMVALQAVMLGANPQGSTTQTSLLAVTVFSWQAVTLVLAWLYFAFWESGAKQSTWGKRMLGIKVVGEDGGRISFGRATARFFCKSFLSPSNPRTNCPCTPVPFGHPTSFDKPPCPLQSIAATRNP